jgi:glycosyltransferase involved in cell wall biosynthesis
MYRRSLSYRSGAGQLIAMQVRGLSAAGANVRLYCQRGALRFLLQSGLRAHGIDSAALGELGRGSTSVVVDHEMALPHAHIVFSHNLMSAAVRYIPRDDFEVQAERERSFFSRLQPDAVVVANSNLVRSELIAQFDIEPGRVRVCYPGFRTAAFDPSQREALRHRARRALGVPQGSPLVGFVTSGDFQKRGLDIFLAAAAEIARRMPEARFLVVGSKQLPDWARSHPLLVDERMHYRPRGSRPAMWMAALDVFLYPARFEEFGMVAVEASALGVPVLTSRLVGASECLPPEFDPWISSEPDSERFAAQTLALLGDPREWLALSGAAQRHAAGLDDARFARESVALIERQKR